MSSFLEEISKDDLQSYPVRKFEGDIVLVHDARNLPKIIRELETYPVLGFDTETRPSFKKGVKNNVALLQLSGPDKAWLFRLNKIGFPDPLRDFLTESKILKPGVAIHDDLKALISRNKFEPAGFIDLQELVKEYSIQSSGLKKLSAIVLGFSISKRQQVTNWENKRLSDAQLVYAATDAWVCYKIYERLINGTS